MISPVNSESATAKPAARGVADILTTRRDEILDLWTSERLNSDEFRDELISKRELRRQSQQIIDMLARSIKESGGGDFESPAFDEMRSFLNEISQQRAIKGYTPQENATYILSLRNVVIPLMAGEFAGDIETLLREMSYFTRLLDKMGLVMVENFIRAREEIIRQQRAHARTFDAV